MASLTPFSFIRVVIMFSVFTSVQASHFRGGFIIWKPIDGTTTIEVTYRIAWRRSFSGNFCDATTIASGIPNNGEGTLYCETCSPRIQIISPMAYFCTDFSVSEDWSSGTNTVTFDYSTAGSSFYIGKWKIIPHGWYFYMIIGILYASSLVSSADW